jgi:hypothetical protein
MEAKYGPIAASSTSATPCLCIQQTTLGLSFEKDITGKFVKATFANWMPRYVPLAMLHKVTWELGTRSCDTITGVSG